MCGILGYTGSNLDIIKRAHALQKHRGPDGDGFYSDDNVSLGHNRLAIIDLNPRAAQPMWDTTRRYSIVFNGEIYNYKEIKADHLQDYQFQTESDTEVLLGLFEKYGTDLTQYIRGMYAFAIYDVADKKLFLFRDEFGIKPLFYSVGDFGLCFASELKTIISILSSHQTTPTIDINAISEYLTLGYTIAPNTLYNEIKILNPKSNLEFDISKKTLTIQESKGDTQKVTACDALNTIIDDNLVADVPVGLFFSGGIDSSVIAAMTAKQTTNLDTFSLHVENRTEDKKFSEKIAETLNISNTSYTFDVAEFDKAYRRLINHIDHPAGSTSIFQTEYLSEKAVAAVKVALMGDGGDELYYGYKRMFDLKDCSTQKTNDGTFFEKLYFRLPQFKGKNALFLYIYKKLKLSASYYILSMSVGRSELTYANWINTKRHICALNIEPTEFDRLLYLPNDLLHKSDLATSFNALEGRVPLTSWYLYTNSRLEALESFNVNDPKIFLKQILLKYLPKNLVYRDKSGFGINYKKIAQKSKYIQQDFEAVKITLLNDVKLNVKSFDWYVENCPQYILVLITLGKAIENNKRITLS